MKNTRRPEIELHSVPTPHHSTARVRVRVGQAGRSCLATRTESGELRVALYLAENCARSKLGLEARGDVIVRVEVGVYLLLKSNRIKGHRAVNRHASMHICFHDVWQYSNIRLYRCLIEYELKSIRILECVCIFEYKYE